MKHVIDYSRSKYLEKNYIILFYIMILFLLLSSKVIGQTISSTTYPLTSSTGVSLTSYTSLGTLITSGNDDANSAVTNIGFDFWFNGVRYTQFGVNSNGHLKLGAAITSTHYINDLADGAEDPKIAPYWDDLTTGSDGYVKYGVTGNAPNRNLVVEWKANTYVNTTSVTSTAPLLFQVILSESTGKIQFIYGGTIATNANGYSIGLSSSGSTMLSIATATDTPTYGSDPNKSQSTSIASGKAYAFNSLVPVAPSNLTLSNVLSTSMTVNWLDNASNEIGYVIYTSTDNVTFTFN